MKKMLLVGAVLPLFLAACDNSDTPKNYDVSGTISGNQPSGKIRMAIVGVSNEGVVNEHTGQVAISFSDSRKFSVDYPSQSGDGVYQVIAYVDGNNNGKYDLGETRTAPNNRFLVHSRNGGNLASFLGLRAGWNYVVGSTVSQPGRVTNYDLSW